MGLIVLPSLRGDELRAQITTTLAPYGPLPEKGPQKIVARDLTEDVRVICFNAITKQYGSQALQDTQKMRSAIHQWCGAHNVTLFDPETKKLDDTGDWKPGLYASITDKGIGRLFEVRARHPLFAGWELGGLWSGFLRLYEIEDAPLEIPEFGDRAWKTGAMHVESIRLASNQDVAEVDTVIWPVRHERGPSLCAVDSLPQRFAENELAGGWAKPWCLFINNELLTLDNYKESEIYKKQKLAEPLDWMEFLTFLFKKIATQTMEPHCVAVLDLKPLKSQ